MLISTVCLIELEDSRIRLDVWGLSYLAPQLRNFFHGSDLNKLKNLIVQSLLEVDFQPIQGGWCKFSKNNLSIPRGYMALQYDGVDNVVLPICSFWLILKVVSIALSELSDSTMSEVRSGNEPSIQELQVLLDQKVESSAYQGVLRIRSVTNEIGWGPAPTWLAEFEARQEWLPFLTQEDIFDRIHYSGTALINNDGFRTRESFGIPVPNSYRANFVQALKIARIWGAYIPTYLYDSKENPDAKATIAVRSYHSLVDYCNNMTSEPNPSRLDIAPFSVDWFHNIKSKMPEKMDLFSFSEECELAWNKSPSIIPEVREILSNGWIFRLFVDEIDIERLGYVKILGVLEDECD